MAKKSKKKGILNIGEQIVVKGMSDPGFKWVLGEMQELLVGYDGGNGKSCAFTFREGLLITSTLPNARVMVSGYEMSSMVDGLKAHKFTTVGFLKHLYGVGQDIWDQTEYPVEAAAGSADRYGSTHQIMLFLVNLVQMGIQNDSVINVITSAPPGIVDDVAPQIKAGFLSGESGLNDGWWSVTVDGETYNYKVNNVKVIPEGAASFAAFVWDINGNTLDIRNQLGNNATGGRVAVMDGGFVTFDSYIIQNGVLNSQFIRHATNDKAGILTHLIKPSITYIQDNVVKAGMSKPHLYAHQVDGYWRKWVSGGRTDESGTFQISGVRLGLHPFFEYRVARYAEWLFAEVFDKMFENNVDAMLLTGGAYTYVGEIVLDKYRKRHFIYPGMAGAPHLETIPVWALNAYGTLPLVAGSLKVKKKA